MSQPRVAGIVLVCSVVVACSSQRPGGNGPTPGPTTGPLALASSPPGMVDVALRQVDAGASAPPPLEETATSEPAYGEIASVLFADRASPSATLGACPPSASADARVRCLFDERYRGDTKAANVAYELYVKWHVVAGVEVAHTMDGGYRGMIRLEPALPIAAERRHLEWIASALDDIHRLFVELDRHRGASDAGTAAASLPSRPKRYRWNPITLRFMRSVGARTPSAYAHDWTVAWNLAGSLHTSAEAVRDTLVHEIFHLNDYAHPPPGGEAWSLEALSPTFDAIVRKCGTALSCLAPYSPNDTIVRGGTYYSFQPGNGVREYAAELALRYFREQRAVLRGLPKVKPFKCGPVENARAWALMRDEFWDGIDVVPSCGP